MYDLLSSSFDDPSATIVYPYVYRILNSASKAAGTGGVRGAGIASSNRFSRPVSPASSRPRSPVDTASIRSHRETLSSHRTSPSSSSANGIHSPFSPAEEPDPDAQLLTIIGHISSETTGALHKEGITELHQFLKAYPHKRPRVEKMLESTGPAFRKYINRALASRAAEDQERLGGDGVAPTLDRTSYPLWQILRLTFVLVGNYGTPTKETRVASPSSKSPTRASLENGPQTDRLSRLHDIFQYRSSAGGAGGGPSAPRTSNDFGSS